MSFGHSHGGEPCNGDHGGEDYDMDDDMDNGPLMDLTGPLPEGITKEIITEAPAGNTKSPAAGDEVYVHYTGTLASDGTKFDSSKDRGQQFNFTLGTGQVIKGWDYGVASMKKGEVAKFTLAPEFAYGEHGSPPTIPGGATLCFEVELFSWKSDSDLFGDDGCIMTIKEKGQGRKPNMDDEVQISYKISSKDGKEFDKEGKSAYAMQLGEAVSGWQSAIDKAVLRLKKGGSCTLECKSEYSHQAAGSECIIDVTLEEIYETNDVSFDSDNSLMKKVIKAGEGFDRPTDNYQVVLKVHEVETATGPAGKDFPKTIEVVIGNGKLGDGLEAAVLEMKLHEEAIVCITKPDEAKDESLGLPAGLAGPIKIRLELLEFEKGKMKWDMKDDEKITFALERKDVGAALFKAGRNKLALQRYKGVASLFDYIDNMKDEEEKKKAGEIKRTCQLNSAMVQLKLGDSAAARESCTTVLKDDSRNVKALFRRATALKELKEFEEAQKDLKVLFEEEPDNKAAKQLQLEVARLQKEADKKQKGVYANMCKAFGKLQPASAYLEPKRPPNEEEGIKFLEENSKKEGVVTLPSGLQYKVLTAGEGKFHPTADSACDCNYEGTLINGEKFDSSYDRGTTTSFAPNQVIKGWTEAMQLMVEGDKWQMFIPSDLAYGPDGSPPKIPGGAALIFTMEIVKIKGATVPKKE